MRKKSLFATLAAAIGSHVYGSRLPGENRHPRSRITRNPNRREFVRNGNLHHNKTRREASGRWSAECPAAGKLNFATQFDRCPLCKKAPFIEGGHKRTTITG